MIDVAVSQVTSPRWDLEDDVERAAALGFEALALWRPKVTDVGASAAAALVSAAGLRVSSLQSAGGFTGGEGRSFAESLEDAIEAIATAAMVGAPVLVVHSGCRGGHTLSHASRLLVQALETLVPVASRAGITLALRPARPGACSPCNFLAGLVEAVDLVERFSDPALRLAVDLWHFGDAPELESLMPRIAAAAAIVQVADRSGPLGADADRLPAGHGELPLERLVADLLRSGYRGAVEFDPVGEAAEILGYEGIWHGLRLVADTWLDRIAASRHEGGATLVSDRRPRSGHFRAVAGSRRSHASSHSGSPR